MTEESNNGSIVPVQQLSALPPLNQDESEDEAFDIGSDSDDTSGSFLIFNDEIKTNGENGETIEPREYFERIKAGVQITERPWLVQQMNRLNEEYERAKANNQTRLLHTIRFSWDVLLRELALIPLGFTKYVYRHELNTYLQSVRPRNSVKACDLEDFPRSIPDAPSAKIQKALDAKIFDSIVVVYTDFTKEKVRTPAEQDRLDRNRDPMVFGLFVDRFVREDTEYGPSRKIVEKHDRAYLIADWVDEYCDLTFQTFLERSKNRKHVLTEDTLRERYERIAKEVKYDERLQADEQGHLKPKEEKSRTWIDKLFGWNK